MTKTKQKPEERNGEVQEIDLETARAIVEEDRRQRIQEFQEKLTQLCDMYGVDLDAQITIKPRG